MPRKSKRKSSSSVALAPKIRRGRPRKFVAPEALLTPEEGGAAMVKKYKSPLESLNPTEVKAKPRRSNPATGDRHYSMDEVEFMNALAEFKRASGRLFPSCSEILDILRKLGYEKISCSSSVTAPAGKKLTEPDV